MSAVIAPLLLSVLAPADCSGLERRLWEVAVRRFERTDAVTQYPADSVLFYGSSSIRLWKTIAEDMAPRPVIQRGYGGARLSDAVNFVDRVVTPHQFSALVIFIANDIDGRPNQPSPQRVGELFGELLAKVRTHHPHEPVFWVEVTATPSRLDLWPMVQEASELIRRQCDADPNTHFVTTSDVFLAGGEPDESLYRSDRLHLSAAGYAVWSGIIRRALGEQDVPGRPRTPEPPNSLAAIVSEDEDAALDPAS